MWLIIILCGQMIQRHLWELRGGWVMLYSLPSPDFIDSYISFEFVSAQESERFVSNSRGCASQMKSS